MKQVNLENFNHEGILQAMVTNQQTFHNELYKDELPWDNQGLPVSKKSTMYLHLLRRKTYLSPTKLSPKH